MNAMKAIEKPDNGQRALRMFLPISDSRFESMGGSGTGLNLKQGLVFGGAELSYIIEVLGMSS